MNTVLSSMSKHVCIFLFFCFCVNRSNCIEATCRGKRINEVCRSDEDCNGFHTICVNGRCQCPFDFDEFAFSEKSKTCKPGPRKVGLECTNVCKSPLLCIDGKCACWRGKEEEGKCTITCPSGQILIGHECQSSSTLLGGTCHSDFDCLAANSHCLRGRCECVPSSTRQGANECILNCPDGSAALKICRKIMINDPTAVANSEKLDSCPKGYSCVTYGKPNIGHCCKIYCPYGSPDLSKSCNGEGVIYAVSCSTLGTHYCQRFDDHGSTNVLCCPRPCNEPNPLFINGRCYPQANLHDQCVYNGQCRGGQSMMCTQGRCACKSGFVEDYRDSKFPTCKRKCRLRQNVEGVCYRKVKFGDSCFMSSMCPKNSICRENVCHCDCNSALSANKCVDPEDPLNVNRLLDTITGILGAN